MSRRKPPSPQTSLFGATPSPVILPPPIGKSDVVTGVKADEQHAPSVDETKRPKLRLVHSVKEWDVTVEATEDPDAFYVTRYRDSGTSSSQMLFTRTQLERLIARAQAALKVT